MLALARAALAALQLFASPDPDRPADDSAGVGSAARRAQRGFESLRRSVLPFRDGRAGTRCDAQVGIFCYWYDAADRRPRAPESARIRQARARLLGVLDSLAVRAPADRAVLGQRVYYRLEQGDTTGAIAVASAGCAAEAWWCDALHGYALHGAGRFAAAGLAFDRALATMDSATRCEWVDVSPLLPGRARGRIESMGCPARADAAARLWWLSDPLLSESGNDFRTEYLARRVVAALHAHIAPTYAMRWNRGVEEITLRYGWPEWWSRARPGPGQPGGPADVVGHERVPSHAFVPAGRVLLERRAVPSSDDWDLHAATPSSRYATPYAERWRTMPAQLSRFARGATMVVVAAFDVSGDPTLRHGSSRLGVVVSPGAVPLLSRASTTRGTLRVEVAAASPEAYVLAGVEVIDRVSGTIARHRAGIAPLPQSPLGLSDLLLYDPSRGTPRTLDDVLPLALPGSAVAGSRLGVYWETYCTTGEPFRVEVGLERTDPSWLARVAARAGRRPTPTTVRVAWDDAPQGGQLCSARALALDVGALARGSYELRVTVRSAAGVVASSSRQVTIGR